MMAIAIVCAVFLALNARKLVISGINITATSAIESSDLPPEQQKGIITQIDRLTEAFNEGTIVIEDIGPLVENLAEGQLLVFGAAYFQATQYIQASNMTDAQKQNAQKIMGRFAQGGIEDKISTETLQLIWDLTFEQTSADNKTLKKTLTAEELQQLLELTTNAVTEANIPDETYQIDIADHVRKAVDKILGSDEALTTNP